MFHDGFKVEKDNINLCMIIKFTVNTCFCKKGGYKDFISLFLYTIINNYGMTMHGIIQARPG